MATLPDAFDLGQRPGLRTDRRIVSDQSGQIEGESLARFGDNVAQIAGRQIDLNQQREDRARAASDKLAYSKAKADYLIADIQARDAVEKDTDWQGSPKRYSEAMTAAGKTAAASITDANTRALFEQDHAVDLAQGTSFVSGVVNRLRVSSENADTEKMLTTLGDAALVTADDGMHEQLFGAINTRLAGASESMNYGPDSQRITKAMGREFTEKFAERKVGMQEVNKRIELLSKPEGHYTSFIAPDRRAELLRQAQAEKDALAKAAKVEIDQATRNRYQDLAVAYTLPGVEDMTPDKVPSIEASVSAFGKVEGPLRRQQALQMVEANKQASTLAGMSNEQLLDTARGSQVTSVIGASDKAPISKFTASIAQSHLEARAKDPAGYLTQSAPATKQAWEKFQTVDPSDEQAMNNARASYFGAIKADAAARGMQDRDLLPDWYAKAMSQKITEAPNANALINNMQVEAEKWGEHWGDVFPQIAKDVPDLAAMVGSGIPRDAALALGKTAGLKQTELEGYLKPGTTWKKAIADPVETKFADFFKSFPADRGATRTANAVRESAERLAATYMHDNGESAPNAVNHAYRDLVEKQNAVVPFRGAQVRIPVTAGVDNKAVVAGMHAALNGFKAEAKEVSIPSDAQFGAERYASDASAVIRKSGYFLTNEKGTGVDLYFNGAKWGRSYTWEQLKAMSDTHRDELDNSAQQRQSFPFPEDGF